MVSVAHLLHTSLMSFHFILLNILSPDLPSTLFCLIYVLANNPILPDQSSISWPLFVALGHGLPDGVGLGPDFGTG